MTITVEQVIATLEEVVAEKGEDYVYPKVGHGCTYAEANGSPSCIVGYVVYKLDPAKFSEFKSYELDYADSFGIDEAFKGDEEENDGIPSMENWEKGAKKILEQAQHRQDAGKTWGEALTAAKSAL